MNAEKSLGTPTGLEYGMWAFLILIAVLALLYTLFAPLISDIMKAI